MAHMRRWSREFITEFIDLYRSLPCLYDIKSKQYSNKHLKLAAYNKLVEKLKTVDAAATKDMVVKKINNLRSSYRKELKKINTSKRNGASGEVYETSLWYFHQLDFLYDHEIPRKRKCNIEDLKSNSEDDEEEGKSEAEKEYDFKKLINDESMSQEMSQNEDRLQNISSANNSSISASTYRCIPKRFLKKHKTTDVGQKQTVLALVTEKLENQNKYSNYAMYVAQELDALPPMMATYCQKLINDALFHAKCGQLTAQSMIATASQKSDKILNS